jgi:tetratricopeptide (TPR) repeat protein
MKMLSVFEDHEDFPSFLMLAGSMLKAMRDFDKAGSYFFEAMNTGPPRFFTRLDMMFIVARTLEESSSSGSSTDEGYIMVHHHLVSDGLISNDVNYEEWISDANTWRAVADKCSIVGIFSLAADLYGQGLNRDQIAFRKTRLWLGFAKACSRSGKNSEAQLALKQALALDANDEQCRVALEQLADMSLHKFESLVQSQDLGQLLDRIPDDPEQKDVAASRIQALARGVSQRSPSNSPMHKSGRSHIHHSSSPTAAESTAGADSEAYHDDSGDTGGYDAIFRDDCAGGDNCKVDERQSRAHK